MPVLRARIVRRLPHDPKAYTQGLTFADGRLIESLGGFGTSTLRKVEPASGRVIRESALPPTWFGEGHARWGGQIISLTWRDRVAMRWDADELGLIETIPYAHDGWGLASDGARLVASDGSATLRFLDPETLEEAGRIMATMQGRPLPYLNDLEFVRGELWANLWQSDLLARIDPASGELAGWVDLRGLSREASDGRPDSVLNGLAPGTGPDTLFVTGKNWPSLYEVRVVEGGEETAARP